MDKIINNSATHQPAIFILGPTGIGKTYVSINLSLKFNGTIINTDAFSLYSSANIMTAKATKTEQLKVPHRMINILSLNDTSYTVNQFTVDATTQIEQVYQSNRVPIMVGGTNYYLESLLFTKHNHCHSELINPFAIEYSQSNKSLVEFIKLKISQSINKENKDALYTEITEYLSTYSISQLNDLLTEIDNSYANFLHQNNIRRIINVIAYYFVYNRRKSDEINTEIKQLRYSNNTKVLLLSTDNIGLLDNRIKARINEMIIEQGGLAEIFWIFSQFNSNNISFTTGVLQAIGYKEFYLLHDTAIKDGNMKIIIDEVISYYTDDMLHQHSMKIYNYISSSVELSAIYNQCKEELIKNTIKFAKYQIKWIKKKILPFISGYHVIHIDEFTTEAYVTYISQAEAFINSSNSNCHINNPIGQNDNNKLLQWKKYHCDICNSDINGESERVDHYKSNTHKKKSAKDKKKIANSNHK